VLVSKRLNMERACVNRRRPSNGVQLTTASTIIGAHIEYYTNLNSQAFNSGLGGFNLK
jgi:hypothetical protein